MNAEKRAHLATLQDLLRAVGGRERMLPAARTELESLERELAIEQQEKADDPNTWLVDEARRPLLGGGDYGDEQRRRDCDEFLAYVERLAVRIGREAALVVVEGFMAAAKRGTLVP